MVKRPIKINSENMILEIKKKKNKITTLRKSIVVWGLAVKKGVGKGNCYYYFTLTTEVLLLQLQNNMEYNNQNGVEIK